MEKTLIDTMYLIPSEKDLTKVVIEDSVIEGKADPIFLYERKEEQASS